jgi:poly-gamma-glutamate synthesis protein (capsule biosynthesis protein)
VKVALVVIAVLALGLFFRVITNQSPQIEPPFVSQLRFSLPNGNVSSPLRSFAAFLNMNPIPPPLSLETIFAPGHAALHLDPHQMTTILVTGDIIPARSVNNTSVRLNNFHWPYEQTADVLRQADITFSNLETPLVENCQPTVEGMRFCGSSANIQGLTFAGIDVVSLANNHAGNYGLTGVTETMSGLNQAGIAVTGVGEPAYKEVNGILFGFVGFNDIGASEGGISSADEAEVKKQIAQARTHAQVVIATFHWGVEYVTQPSQRQRKLGHLAIDAGADLVIGNHPHWIQPIEFYNGKLITYAHGNFVFDQEWSQKTKEGVVGKYTFYNSQLIDVEYLPVEIINYGQPYFLSGEKKQRILNEMKQASLELAR